VISLSPIALSLREPVRLNLIACAQILKRLDAVLAFLCGMVENINRGAPGQRFFLLNALAEKDVAPALK
jgi:hypothetical protein